MSIARQGALAALMLSYGFDLAERGHGVGWLWVVTGAVWWLAALFDSVSRDLSRRGK